MRLRIKGGGTPAAPPSPGRRGRRTAALATLLALALAAPIAATTSANGAAGAAPASDTDDIRQYEVHVHGSTSATRTAIAQAGVSIDEADEETVVVSGRAAQAKKLRQLGYEVTPLGSAPDRSSAADAGILDFPSADSRYHNYAEMNAEIDQRLAAYPGIMSKRVIGKSYQGRDIVAIKISDNVGDRRVRARGPVHPPPARARAPHRGDGALPAARAGLRVRLRLPRHEHGEQPRDLDRPGPQPGRRRVRHRLRRLPLVAQEPPAQQRQFVRRHRPEPQLELPLGLLRRLVGLDVLRDLPGHGAAESAPEVKVVADFVRSRVVGGKQQIRAGVDFHTYSELVLWPFGYTNADTTTGMTADDRNAFATVGQKMAASNGYTPEQSSDLYITDGSIDDYLWGSQKIFAYTFEMYPASSGGGGFYPPDEVIERETARNRDAVLQLLENSDCMYRSIGKEAQYR